MKQPSRTLTLLAGAIALVTVSAAADAERYHGSSGSGKYTTGSGESGTYEWGMERSEGTSSSGGSITTPEGKTYSRSKTRSYDPETGSVTRSVTSPGGETRSIQINPD